MGGTRSVGVDMAPWGLRGKRFLLFDKTRQPPVNMSIKLPCVCVCVMHHI